MIIIVSFITKQEDCQVKKNWQNIFCLEELNKAVIMTIKTKYSIGETIEFDWLGIRHQEQIRGIYIASDNLEAEDVIYYQTNTLKLVQENKIL